MKCTSKIEYDCFYLKDEKNAEKFFEWIKDHFGDEYCYCYIIYDDFILIQFNTSNEEIYLDDLLEDELDNYKCYYNRWYVIKHGDLFDYDAEYFIKQYNLSM